MTKLQIMMMLHYYITPKPYAQNDPEHANSIAVKEQRNDLLNWEMLTYDGSYKVTEKGIAYVDALGEVKMPISKTIWIQPE